MCPKSVIGVWEREIAKFADFPHRIVTLSSSMSVAQRAARVMATSIMPFDGITFFVVNYDVLRYPALLDALVDAKVDVMIADEAHRLKNSGSAQSKAARKISEGAIKIAATGTPTDTPQDWYGIYRWLDPSIFGTSQGAFRHRYFVERPLANGIKIIVSPRPEMQAELLEKAHQFAHVCTKEQALPNLPGKAPDMLRFCDLEPSAAKMYREMRDEAISYIDPNRPVVGQNAMTRLLRLGQITSGFLRDSEGTPHQVSEAKLKLLSDVLEDVLEQEEKVVISALRTPEINAIKQLLERKPFLLNAHRRSGVIDGNVTQAKRDEAIRAFSEDDDPRIIIVQERAGGAGVNLQARCSMMIHYSLGSSSIDYRQVKDRIDRIGQKNVCRYILLAALVDEQRTVDEINYESLCTKTDMAKMTPHSIKGMFL